MSATGECSTQTDLAARFRATRRQTLALREPLTPEDMMVQSCPEASPAKWHLAHTAWFFESFILREFLPGYRLFNEDFPWLFNSYYQSFTGEAPALILLAPWAGRGPALPGTRGPGDRPAAGTHRGGPTRRQSGIRSAYAH
jgi:hypothetical protein